MSARPTRQRSNATDFRPRYPLDPFTKSPMFSSGSECSHAMFRLAFDLHEPWLLKSESLPTPQVLRKDVALVLGTPVDKSLHPLLLSPGLSNSLVIIATHVPPPSASFAATVRILRLSTPLVIEDNGAVRLVSILEWAEKIARIWRTHGANGADCLEFDEGSIGNPESLPRIARSTPGSPVESSFSLRPSKSINFGLRAKHLSLLGKRKDSSTSSGFASRSSLPPIDPFQRPFDAIINYVSEGVAERQILKQTILVTSITRPFLASTLSPYHKLSQFRDKSKSNRKSVILNRSWYSLPPTPPNDSRESLPPAPSTFSSTSSSTLTAPSLSAHMIHILPRSTRSNLVQSLNSFLSSFSVSNVSDDVEHAKQYIMHGSTLCGTVMHPHEQEHQGWTVAELILHGCFDDFHDKSWIGSSEDVLLLQLGGSIFGSRPTSSRRSSYISSSKSLNDHIPIIHTHLGTRAPTRAKSAHLPNITISDLTPPPSSSRRSRVRSVPLMLDTPSSPTPANWYGGRSRPHSEILYSTGSVNDLDNVPQNAPLPPPSPSRYMNGPRSAPAFPPGPSIPTPTGAGMPSGRELTKVSQRSKLNILVQVDEHGELPTPPDSVERLDNQGGNDKMSRRWKVLSWRFWRAIRVDSKT